MPDATATGGYYPPVSFYFKVEFPVITDNAGDNRFQSVSGLTVDFDTENFNEGGENRFVHKLPTRAKYPNLVLKRGMVTDSKLIKWCRDAFESMIFQPTDLVVKLLDERGEPLKSWNVVNAYPVKWTISDFNSGDNSIVVETLELTYSYFKVI